MRSKPYCKKLVSYTEDSKYFLDKIQEMSVIIGLSESRIIEDCMCFGFVCLYDPESINELKNVFTKRYGKIADHEYIDRIISALKPSEKEKYS